MNKRKRLRPLATACLLLAGSGAWAEDAARLGEVTVTSTTIDDRFESKRDEPSNISVISGKKVDDAHAQNVIQVLQSIPGVTADLSSGDEIKIKLRGIENQRYMGEKPGVAIVIDGVPVFERTGKVNIDLDNIESIKVIKGGASYLFGDDGLAGAVIITTKRGAKYAGYTVGAETGSYGYQKEMARAGFAGEWGSGHVQVSSRQADDYYFQSAYKTDYANGNLNLYLNDTSDLTLGFEVSRRNKDKHGNVTGVTQAIADPQGTQGRDYTRKYDVDLQKLNLTYANNYAANSNILLTGYEYRDHTVFWSAPQKYTTAGVPVTSVDAYTTNNDYHQLQRGMKGEWRSGAGNMGWLAGMDVRRNNYQNYNTALTSYCSRINGAVCAAGATVAAGTVFSNDSTDEAVNALYGELKVVPAARWTVTFNGRYDNIGLDYSSQQTSTTAPFSRTKEFNVSSWRGGANYAVSEVMDFYGNVATGFRAPTVDQLYRGSISPSAMTANNENLKPEKAINMEIGARAKTVWFGIPFDLDAALFQIDRKDYIMSVNGQYAGSGVVDRYENIGGVRNRGFELALKSDRKREVTLDVAYSYIQAKFTQYDNYYQILGNQYGQQSATCSGFDPTKKFCLARYNNTGNTVPRVPAHQLNATLAWQPDNRLRLSLEMDVKSWAYADEINQEKIAGRTLFNALVNYDIKEKGMLGAKWSLFGRVDNLFAKNYWVAARGTNDAQSYYNGFKYDGKYNAEDLSIIVSRGRVWSAGVSATF